MSDLGPDLWRGQTITMLCSCGRLCPLTWDAERDTLVVDHGGEAVYIMPPEEWAAIPSGGLFILGGSSLVGWLAMVHEYEGAIR